MRRIRGLKHAQDSNIINGTVGLLGATNSGTASTHRNNNYDGTAACWDSNYDGTVARGQQQGII